MKALTETDRDIQSRIFTLRGVQIMLDRDLAHLYGVTTKRLNEQVKRNIKRFPASFRFQLSDSEKLELVANCDRLHTLKHSSVNPFAFTEQGVAMLSAVLKSEIAIEVSIRIIKTFVEMRTFLLNNASIFQRLTNLEQKVTRHEENFDLIFKAIGNKPLKPKQGIFFDGQIFDAYAFVSDLIRSAEKSIILIDNYVDDTVLVLFTKRKPGVSVTIYTKSISKQLALDLEKHNAQYPPVEITEFNRSHDRFLIIDENTVYHLGASLKDLGKKWFAFSKFDLKAMELLNKIK